MLGLAKQAVGHISAEKWTFAGYALVALGLAGGSGIWLPIVMPDRELAMDSLFSFVMASVGPPTLDLVLRNCDSNWTKGKRMAVVVVASLAMTLSLCAFLQGTQLTWLAWSTAWIAVTAAVGCWLFANFRGENGKFSDGPPLTPTPPGAAVGDPSALSGKGWT